MLRRMIFGLLLIPTLVMAQSGPPYRNPVRDPQQIASVTQAFAKSLQGYLGIEAKVWNCRHVVDQAVGTARGNHSYGAICQVEIGGKNTSVMLCNDRMIGHFALNAGTFAYNDDDVADFTRQNCYGG